MKIFNQEAISSMSLEDLEGIRFFLRLGGAQTYSHRISEDTAVSMASELDRVIEEKAKEHWDEEYTRILRETIAESELKGAAERFSVSGSCVLMDQKPILPGCGGHIRGGEHTVILHDGSKVTVEHSIRVSPKPPYSCGYSLLDALEGKNGD